MSNLQNLIDLLKSDLRNECTHLMFYLQSASLVQGLHSKEYKEHFLSESQKEIKHTFNGENYTLIQNDPRYTLIYPANARLNNPNL